MKGFYKPSRSNQNVGPKSQGSGLQNQLMTYMMLQNRANIGGSGEAPIPPGNTQTAFDNPAYGIKAVNIPAEAELAAERAKATSPIEVQKSTETEQAKTSLVAGQDLSKILNLTDNLISAIKSANIQQGGGSPFKAPVGKFAAAIGQKDTGNIKALKNVKRDTALGFTRVLAGGARGVATLFNKFLDSIPDSSYTSEQSGSTIAELNLTGLAFKKGVDDLELTQSQIDKLSPEQAATLISKGRGFITSEETQAIYKGMAKKFKEIQPRQQIDLEGNVSYPRINPLNKFIFQDVFGKSSDKFQGQSSSGLQEFKIGNKIYRIPPDQVDSFKKDMGIK